MSGWPAHGSGVPVSIKLNDEGFLPCPFCNGEPDYKYFRPDPEDGDEFVCVCCRHCGAQTTVCVSEVQAKHAWNRRVK
jgi:hypothetical protein